MKASNPQVMIQAYRLLVNRLNSEGLQPYPLHLGVTEAGEGEDGRIKSALGIGSLLEDGLGDTVRVSLTEEPELEAPVAKMLVDRYHSRPNHASIPDLFGIPIDPFSYQRRMTRAVENIGGSNVPRVIIDLRNLKDVQYQDLKVIGHHYLPELDKWSMNDTGADYIYSGQWPVQFMLPNGLKEILDFSLWAQSGDLQKFPLITIDQLKEPVKLHPRLNFIKMTSSDLDSVVEILQPHANLVVWLETDNQHALADQRRFIFELISKNILNPVIIGSKYEDENSDALQLKAGTDMGALLIDGLGDGVFLSRELLHEQNRETTLSRIKHYNQTCFNILQAARTRMTKTEYISCPSCGRTLFDLQETTAMIRQRTDHLKGVKIGIMGCIVNGPGEMADADYGYVGSGKGKITLYKGQEVIKRGVPSTNAVDELIEIIKADGQWIEPQGDLVQG
jgi:(E)-4-hydroxy-3-methylbut-2-enyl-diphosphate synthase